MGTCARRARPATSAKVSDVVAVDVTTVVIGGRVEPVRRLVGIAQGASIAVRVQLVGADAELLGVGEPVAIRVVGR